jgi:hypothetical protein
LPDLRLNQAFRRRRAAGLAVTEWPRVGSALSIVRRIVRSVVASFGVHSALSIAGSIVASFGVHPALSIARSIVASFGVHSAVTLGIVPSLWLNVWAGVGLRPFDVAGLEQGSGFALCRCDIAHLGADIHCCGIAGVGWSRG